MRWLRRRAETAADMRPPEPEPAPEPVVMTVTTALDRSTALDLVRRVERVPPAGAVVIDLTAIPAFDSAGAEILLELQHAHPDRSLSIVGLRQAAARLMAPLQTPDAGDQNTWVLRRLRNLLVVQPARRGQASVDGLDEALGATRLHPDAAIIVLDLLDVADLTPSAVEAVAFASSAAALNGQELLVVNAAAASADALRAAGLSATTYVAPPELPRG